jgi:cyanate permease
MMAWFAQIYLYEAGVKPAQFGVLWTFLNLFVFIGSFMAVAVNRWITTRQALWGMLIVLSFGFLIASQSISKVGIVFLTVFYLARGIAHPILKDRINALTSSDIRATVLSIRSLVIRCMFSAFGPILGYVSEKINLSTALIACGISVFIPGIFFLILIFKTQKEGK